MKPITDPKVIVALAKALQTGEAEVIDSEGNKIKLTAAVIRPDQVSGDEGERDPSGWIHRQPEGR